MQAEDALLTIAELAIGLAGFSGVVVAFMRDGEMSLLDRWRFAGVFALSVGAAVLAFVPFLMRSFGASDETVWRGSSAVLLAFSLAYTLLPRRILVLAREARAMPPRPALGALAALSATNLTLQLSNTVGWPAAPGPSLFLIGLLIWLVVVAVFFAFVVLARPTR